MAKRSSVDIDELIKYVGVEATLTANVDEEDKIIENLYAKQSVMYCSSYINRDLSDLKENELEIFKTVCIMMSLDMYYNRAGESDNFNQNKPLFLMLNHIRRPQISVGGKH